MYGLHLRSCRLQRDADLDALAASGRGDVSLAHLQFRCTRCRSRLTDAVVMSKDSAVVPVAISAPSPGVIAPRLHNQKLPGRVD